MSYDARRIQDEAATIRDLEALGAIHLDRPRTIGFERRQTRRRVAPFPTSPGAGSPVPDFSWMERR